MAIKIDYAETAKTLVELVGGPDNVKTVSHCMTRLRFTLADPSKADKDALKNVRGVLGVVEAGSSATSVIGIPALAVTYNNSLLPALMIALVAAYAEKFFNKIVPGIFKSLFVGLGTITVTGILAFTILGPFGDYIGNMIANAFLFLGGAALGVALRAKDPEYKAQAFSIAFGCIVAGVSEPCIYGITFKLKKPMFGVMAGGLASGIVAGLLHVKAYVMGYSTIMALPIFMETAGSMLIAIIIGIAVSTGVTFMCGFDQDLAHI
ncbi:MAG: PTS transporter subunit EIIB [Lachnospiraceae bacterium]|nr:PTS transporter subunit EIIB [Lachnospiraceae bacterium]